MHIDIFSFRTTVQIRELCLQTAPIRKRVGKRVDNISSNSNVVDCFAAKLIAARDRTHNC